MSKSMMYKYTQPWVECLPHLSSTPHSQDWIYDTLSNTVSERTPNVEGPVNHVTWIMKGWCLFFVKICCKAGELGLCSRMTGKNDYVFHRTHKFGWMHAWISLSGECGEDACAYFERWEVPLVPGINQQKWCASLQRKKTTLQGPSQLLLPMSLWPDNGN